jgi:hypothetical protein
LDLFGNCSQKDLQLYPFAGDKRPLKEFATHEFNNECCKDTDDDTSQNRQKGILHDLAFSFAD